MIVAEILARLRADVNQFTGPVHTAQASMQSLERGTSASGAKMAGALRGAQQAAGQYAGSLGILGTVGMSAWGAVATAAIGALGFGIKFAADIEQAEIAFTTMLGSGEKARAFLEEMKDFAARTPFEFPDLVVATRRMMALGFEADEVIPLLTDIGNAVAAMGGSAEMINRVTLALGQMQAKGVVSGEEMRQLAETGVFGWKQLAATIGVSIPEAMKMVEQRSVSAAIGIQSFIEHVNAEFQGSMEAQSQTLLGLWSTLKDKARFLLGDIAEPLLVVAKDVASFAISVMGVIGPLFEALEPFIPLLMRFAAAWLALKVIGAISGALQTFLITLIPVNARVATTTAEFWAMGQAGTAAAVGVGALTKSLVVAGLRLAGIVVAFEAVSSLLRDAPWKDAPAELAESMELPIEVTREFERQLQSTLRMATTFASVSGDIEKAGQVYKDVLQEALDAGVPLEVAQAELNRRWREAVVLLGGRGGGFDLYRTQLRDILGLTADGAKLTGALTEEIKAHEEAQNAAAIAAQKNTRAAEEQVSRSIKGIGQLRDMVEASGESWRDFQVDAGEAFNTVGKEAPEAQAAAQEFVDATIESFRDWRDELAGDFNFVQGALSDLAGEEDLTASKILKSFDKQLVAMDRYKANWALVAKTFGEQADGMLGALAEMGPQGAAILQAMGKAIRSDNAGTVRKIIDDWNRAEGKAQDLAGVITNTIGATLKDIREILVKIAKRWGVDVDVTGNAESTLIRINDQLSRIRGTSIYITASGHQITHGGGLIRHAGGGIGDAGGSFAPHFLKSDERPAILQVGEWVVPRDVVRQLGAPFFQGLSKMHAGGGVRVPAMAAGGGGGGGGVDRIEGRMTITDWERGMGYIRARIVRDEIEDEARYQGQSDRMRRT